MIIPQNMVKQAILSYNFVNIEGLKSGGKTRLAIELSELFLRDGWRLITNVNTIWADDLNDVEQLPDGTYRVVILLDEGGWYVRTLETIRSIAVETAKMGVVFLSPSVMLPHEELWSCVFSPTRIRLGNNVILWKIRYTSFEGQGTSFFIQIVSNWAQNVYETSSPGGRPSALLSKFDEWVKSFAKFYDVEEYGLSDLANPNSIRGQTTTKGSITGYTSFLDEASAYKDRRKNRKKQSDRK